jgi:hypothetical protein
MKGLQKIRAYTKQRQLATSGLWHSKDHKARFRRIFKKGARQAGKIDTAERLND